MARKTKEEALETRERILCAALDVFSKKGYSKTTFVDIAKRIGLTKGAVYWHFKSKEELLVDLVRTMLKREDRYTKEMIEGEIHLHNLKDYFISNARLVLENEETRKFVFFITLQMEWTAEHLTFTHNKIKQLKTGLFEETRRVLEKAKKENLLKKSVDIRQAEDCFIGLYTGLIKRHLSGFASGDLIRSIEMGFDAIINTIKVD